MMVAGDIVRHGTRLAVRRGRDAVRCGLDGTRTNRN